MAQKNNHPLAKWREDNHVTQKSLAGDLGRAENTIWRWENLKQTPHRDDIERISKHTGLTAAQILHLECAP